ncbi:MAG: hypothetical protein JW712_00490 [Dehalococcoidales bacterium]|nr:hypothetical protein [Dehalococcoidales bacterium]
MSNKLTVLDPVGQPSGIFGRRLDEDSPMFAIHDPTFQPRDTAENLGTLKMAERPGTLENKTVYLVNTGFAGGREFMEELQAWFTANKPEVKTVLKNKTSSMFTDEPGLWKEIKENSDAVVFGVGG